MNMNPTGFYANYAGVKYHHHNTGYTKIGWHRHPLHGLCLFGPIVSLFHTFFFRCYVNPYELFGPHNIQKYTNRSQALAYI